MGAKEGRFKRYIVTEVDSYDDEGHKEARNRNWRLDKFQGQGRMRKAYSGIGCRDRRDGVSRLFLWAG